MLPAPAVSTPSARRPRPQAIRTRHRVALTAVRNETSPVSVADAARESQDTAAVAATAATTNNATERCTARRYASATDTHR